MDRLPYAFIASCMVLLFVVLATVWFIRIVVIRAQASRRRRTYTRSLVFILKDFIRFCLQEYKTATVSLRALDMSRRDEAVRNFTVSGSPEYLSKLGFMLFQSSDRVLFEDDVLKTSATLFSLRDQIISQQEHVSRFLRYASDTYRAEEKIYDDNFYALRLLYDRLRLYTDTVSDLRIAEWMDAYFRIFDDYATQGRSRDVGVSYPMVVLRILRMSQGFRDVTFAVEAIEHALRCDAAYTHIHLIDQELAGQLRHFAHSHRLAYKLVTRIVAAVETPTRSATAIDIVQDLFRAGSHVRRGAERKAITVKATGWRGVLARISGAVLIICGVLLLIDTLLFSLPQGSFMQLFESKPDTLHVTRHSARAMKGMDLSKYYGNFVQDGVATEVDFIICKATEGSKYIDPDFGARWRVMHATCNVRGAYHVYYDTSDPVGQAQHYMEVVQRFDQGDVPMVAIEHGSLTGAANPATLQADLIRFLLYIEQASGRRPMIYTNRKFANSYLLNPVFGHYPLWLIDYSRVDKPLMPEAWKETGYTVWQRSNAYANTTQAHDLDLFNGDSATLHAFAGSHAKK